MARGADSRWRHYCCVCRERITEVTRSDNPTLCIDCEPLFGTEDEPEDEDQTRDARALEGDRDTIIEDMMR